jgi:hypothetical protein
MAYKVSIRGTRIPTLCASLIGDPRYVSTSIGRFAAKSWYMMLFASPGRIISAIIFFLKAAGKLHS